MANRSGTQEAAVREVYAKYCECGNNEDLCQFCEDIERRVGILQDRGFSREYSYTIAPLDAQDDIENAPQGSPFLDCSVCHGTFTERQYRYHYHPCE